MAPSDRINDQDLSLQDIMQRWPQSIPVFIKHKMLCVGCAITPFHTVQDACFEHGVAEATFREELGQAIRTP